MMNPAGDNGNKINTRKEFIKRFDTITTAIKKIDMIGICLETEISKQL
jgi:hypothetical protein